MLLDWAILENMYEILHQGPTCRGIPNIFCYKKKKLVDSRQSVTPFIIKGFKVQGSRLSYSSYTICKSLLVI